MYVGIPNPNAVVPLEKMIIKNNDKGKEYTVLYNPQSYRRERSVSVSEQKPTGADGPLLQFTNGGGETLTFQLFLDSMSAGAEAGGGTDKLKFAANSLLPSLGKAIDVRKKALDIYQLTKVDEKLHRPPMVTVMWQKLEFTGIMSNCVQEFTKFNETGMAVRATLSCTIVERLEPKKMFGSQPQESPDTTKYCGVKEGDSLWALASMEYGDVGKWRVIAGANGIANPRLLHTGDIIRIPALKN